MEAEIITKAVEKLKGQGHVAEKKIETGTYVSYFCHRCGRYLVCELDPDIKKWVLSGSLIKYRCSGALRK